jgi:hypothetical protein
MTDEAQRRLSQRKAGWEATLRLAVDTILGLQPVMLPIAEFDALGTGTHLILADGGLGGTWARWPQG